MLDVDHFKQINDLLGHQGGDKLLQSLATYWRTMLRARDTLGRFGGDEFIVVRPNCTNTDATAVLSRLRGPGNGTITCSIGATQWHEHDSASLLISRADSGLYEAKRLGRDRIVWAGDARMPITRMPAGTGTGSGAA